MRRTLAHNGIDLLFDARHIRQTGIGSYIRAQLPYLEEAIGERKLSLALLVNESTAPAVRESTTLFFSNPPSVAMYSIREQRAWHQALDSIRPRAIWLPHYPFPLSLLRQSNNRIMPFVTVHDTAHILKKRISGLRLERRIYARAMLNIDVRKCRRIITPSQATAADLLELTPHAPVTVSPIPIDSAWFEPAHPKQPPVDGKYILYVGLAQRRKNLPILLKAYAEIANALPHKLVIAGGGDTAGRNDERIDVLAATYEGRVQIIGRVDFNALRSLVAGADLLVMPSLHEGAGLPPLEAMACHTAVISSDIPALRETCGEGAAFFDPYDHHALAQLIRRYCCEDQARAELAKRGWAHVMRRQSTLSFATAAEAVCSELD